MLFVVNNLTQIERYCQYKGRYNGFCCLVAWILINQRVTALDRNSLSGDINVFLHPPSYISVHNYLVTNISFSEFSRSSVTTVPSL